MNPSKRWKYLKIWVLISLALIVLFPDVVFDTTTNILGFLFDHFVEFSHILFETDLHSTQTIVFYVLLAIGSYLLYRMGRYFLHLYRRSRLAWSEFRTEHPFDAMEYWRELTRFEKIKLIVIPMVILYLYVMFFM